MTDFFEGTVEEMTDILSLALLSCDLTFYIKIHLNEQ